MKKTKIAVFVSGGGTNLQAIIDYAEAGKIPHGELSLVLSSQPDAYALTRAEMHNIPTEVVPRRMYDTQDKFEDAICKAIALDGDSDTLASLAGALAGLMYDIDGEFIQQMFSYIPKEFANILCKFYYNFIR
jgi:phosphoribosylglycinamide formyltransferase-1